MAERAAVSWFPRMYVFLPFLLGCLSDPPVAAEALTADATAARRVWMFRRTDAGWTRRSAPVAHSMSSLGLGTVDGAVVLTGQCFWGDCGSIFWRNMVGPPVHGIQSSDLETWSPVMWRLKDLDDRVPIDTEIRSTPGGAEVWYYGTPAGQMGDPAAFEQPHNIYSARVEGDTLVDPVVRMTAPHLADPAPLRFGDKQLVFLTVKPGHEVGVAMGEPLRVVHTWRGVSVPHAMVVDGVIWAWAQRVEAGRFVPVRSTSRDGVNWSPWQAVLPTADRSCANPVGTVFASQPVVFCVEEPVPTLVAP